MRKLTVITGGTKGIGRALVKRFAAGGSDVITCSRNAAELAALEKEAPGVTGIQADLSTRKGCADFGQAVRALNRPIDVLINNTGYFVPGSVTTEPEGTLESMIQTNLYSAYYVTRALIGAINKSGGGHIFNMCSIASITAYPDGGSYSISKFALLGFSKVLREELKKERIRVTAVLPGATRTPSWDGTTLPDSRFMPAEDIAEAVFNAWSLSERTVIEELLLRPQLGDI